MSNEPTELDKLRKSAEMQLADVPDTKQVPHPAEKLLHELQIHQIELEMQNEALRQSQIELEESRDRFVDFYDFSPVGYITLNNKAMIDEINLTGAELLGVERNKLTHRSFFSFVAEEDRDSWHRRFQALLKNDDKQSCELVLQRHDGSRFYALLKCLHLNREGKEPVVRIVLTDITERKQAESDLRIAATAFESHESLMITDANMVILRVNQAFTKFTGYMAEEVVGHTPRMLKSGRHDAAFYAAMWESINRTGSWQGEIWDRQKNGDISPKWLTVSAVKGADGIVTHYIGVHIDIAERKAAENEIHLLAFYDPLTGLPNRRLLMDRFHHALASNARIGRVGALLFIDLDNFKNINDTLGHDIGDLLLQQVAQRLTSCVRSDDTVSRLGGDEFVVLLETLCEQPIEAAAQTEAVCEKIHASLRQPYQLDRKEYQGTASIGVTLFKGNSTRGDELMKQADIAMYQAKQAGRNTLRFFDQKMQASITSRFSLESELRKALVNQEFLLYYQIQVTSLHKAFGVEALIRWVHPLRGMVSPAQFIPVAEETGLILPIGQWVLETACAQLKAWQQDALTRNLTLAVNVSAKQFHQKDFVLQVQAVIQHHAINPNLLKLELTEGMLLENIEETISIMDALNKIGIQLSLDDFGTGYSSLQYLRRLPLDQIKIDQSFVRDIVTNSDDEAIVRTIIAMAHNLKLDIIAEGVETEEQRQLLFNNGCNYYQGYLFSQPIPIEQFEILVKQSWSLLGN